VLVFLSLCGCDASVSEIYHNIIPPEQRTIAYRDPAPLPSVPLPELPPPRTVSKPRPETPDWYLSLDDAIRIALENTNAVRILTGTTAVASGQTIYDAAITNTTIDQALARFDPTLQLNNTWSRTNMPFASENSVLSSLFLPGTVVGGLNSPETIITSTPTDSFQSVLGVTKTNVLGGQFALTYTENPEHFANGPFISNLLDPEQTHTLLTSYTQPLLQGAGFRVNMAPVVIARLNTEQSYFQYKDSVQGTVLGVIQAYWNLVQARTDVWARKIQLELSEETYKREKARLETGLGNRGNEAQARVTYNQFRANLIAAEAAALTQEGALRNIMGLPPDDDRKLIPVSAPTTERLDPDWQPLLHLAEERRPDIVELKLIVEADKQRLLQAENQTLPQLNLVSSYQWNGLSGTMPNGEAISTGPGQYNNWSVGINFSVPLGLRQARAQVRQQNLTIARDRVNVEQQVHAAVHEIAATVRDLASDYDQYLAYKETRAAAFDNVQVQIGNERVGLVNYLNVLTALNDFGSAVSSEAQQLVAYNVALATLERQTGTILETHGLVFNEERFRAAGPIPCHSRSYPESQPPAGTPQRYPSSGEPAENAFDLQKPDPRNARPGPDQLLPPPRPVEK
jgi:outer membrane protein TolC